MDTQGVRAIYNAEDRTEYEASRWTSSAVALSGYILTKESIERLVFPHLRDVHDYLELGAGPGTWTKLNASRMPETNIHLVDISRTMLESAKKNLATLPNVTYTEKDFLDFIPDKSYDVFFSSRAIEYFPDKAPVVATIARSLKNGGKAMLITKMPHYARMRILRKEPPAFHANQVSPQEIAPLFQKEGMRILTIAPVFAVFPGFHSASLNLVLTRLLRMFPWNPLTASVSESYIIIAEKV